MYVFTDASASDYKIVGKVLDVVQRKQSQVSIGQNIFLKSFADEQMTSPGTGTDCNEMMRM